MIKIDEFESLFNIKIKEIHRLIRIEQSKGLDPVLICIPEVKLFGIPLMFSGNKVEILTKPTKEKNNVKPTLNPIS